MAVQFLGSYTNAGLYRDTKTQWVNSLQHKQLVRQMSELGEITCTLKDALTETNIEGEKRRELKISALMVSVSMCVG